MPSFWNDGGARQRSNNCYNYAMNVASKNGQFAHPGVGYHNESKLHQRTDNINCDFIIDLVDIEGGVEFLSEDGSGYCPSALPAKTALAVIERYDYHFLRLDDQNLRNKTRSSWTHKRGRNPVKAVDESGQQIFDLSTADIGDYQICAYFCTSSSSHD